MIDAATFAAIAQSYATYARAVDEKRWDLFEQVFAPDAALDYRILKVSFTCSGADAPKRFAAFLERCYWTNHLIGAPMVERAAERVRATARLTATHLQRRLDGSTNRWLVRGSYHDTFEPRAGEWRIVRRDCFCLDVEGEFEEHGVELHPGVTWAGRDRLG